MNDHMIPFLSASYSNRWLLKTWSISPHEKLLSTMWIQRYVVTLNLRFWSTYPHFTVNLSVTFEFVIIPFEQWLAGNAFAYGDADLAPWSWVGHSERTDNNPRTAHLGRIVGNMSAVAVEASSAHSRAANNEHPSQIVWHIPAFTLWLQAPTSGLNQHSKMQC